MRGVENQDACRPTKKKERNEKQICGKGGMANGNSSAESEHSLRVALMAHEYVDSHSTLCCRG